MIKNKSIALCLAVLVVAALASNYRSTLADDAADEILDLRAQIAEHEYQGSVTEHRIKVITREIDNLHKENAEAPNFRPILERLLAEGIVVKDTSELGEFRTNLYETLRSLHGLRAAELGAQASARELLIKRLEEQEEVSSN